MGYLSDGLDTFGYDVIDGQLPVGRGPAGLLFPALHQVQQQAKGHQPDLLDAQVQVADAHIDQAGKDRCLRL